MSDARTFEDALIALQAEAPVTLISSIGELAQAHARELAAARAESCITYSAGDALTFTKTLRDLVRKAAEFGREHTIGHGYPEKWFREKLDVLLGDRHE